MLGGQGGERAGEGLHLPRVAEMAAAGWAGAESLAVAARVVVVRAAWWVVRVGSAGSAAGWVAAPAAGSGSPPA